MMLSATHPENPATEAQLSCPIALFGSPSPQFSNCHQQDDGDGVEEEEYGPHNDDDYNDVIWPSPQFSNCHEQDDGDDDGKGGGVWPS